MDVFGVHQQLIDDYRSFTTGVVDVAIRGSSSTWPRNWPAANNGRSRGSR